MKIVSIFAATGFGIVLGAAACIFSFKKGMYYQTNREDADVFPEKIFRLEGGGLPIKFLDAIEENDIIVLGEVHGTKDFPKIFGQIIQDLTGRGYRLTVGLEMPDAITPCMVEYFGTGEGNELAKCYFLKDNFDGRVSTATIKFFKIFGDLRIERFVFFDPEGSRDRERHMAEKLAQHAQLAEKIDKLVVYSGNIHSRLAGIPELGLNKVMAMYLRELMPQKRMVTLTVNYSHGSNWACNTDTCEVQTVTGANEAFALRDYALISRSNDILGHNGVIHLEKVSYASPFKACINDGLLRNDSEECSDLEQFLGHDPHLVKARSIED